MDVEKRCSENTLDQCDLTFMRLSQIKISKLLPIKNLFHLYFWVGMSSNKATLVCLHAIYVVCCVTFSKLKLTNFPLSFFPPHVIIDFFVSIKLVDHPYITRSKGIADSFSGQSSYKGKAVMGDKNNEISLTDIVVFQPTIDDQNKLIMQLMQ